MHAQHMPLTDPVVRCFHNKDVPLIGEIRETLSTGQQLDRHAEEISAGSEAHHTALLTSDNYLH